MSTVGGPRLSTIIPTFFNDYSFEFDGTDDKVTTNSAIVGSDITLSGWYNFNAASYTSWQYQFATCITPSNAPNAALGKFYKRGTQMEIGVQAYDQNSANYSTYAVRVQLEGAGWNHVVWTYNDTTKHIYCYLNGVAQTWTNYGGTITTPYLTGNPIHLYGSNLIMGASSPTSTTGFFSGLLDEVSTYDRILTPSEITGIYNGGIPNDLTSLSPYGWWRNGDNSLYKYPQWLLPSNENKDKVSNYSMSFDGTDDYINVGSTPLLDFRSPFTISLWAKWSYTPSFDCFLQVGRVVGSGTEISYVLLWLHSTGIGWSVSSSPSLGINYNIGLGSNDGNWHHIALTSDGTSGNGTVYIDGVLNTDTPLGTGVASSSATFNNIGRGHQTTGRNFNGTMDEISFFDSQKSALEIADIYNEGEPTTISGAVAHYKMGEEATFDGTNWAIPDVVGSSQGTTANMGISDRVGDAPNSENNALSYNMVLSGRTTDVPT